MRIPGPPGTRNAVIRPGEGANVSGSSALIRHSMAWPRKSNLPTAPFECFAGRDTNLRFHQVNLRHHLGDGMLDLNARIHLDEVEIARSVTQEFDGSGVGITDLRESLDYLFADALAGRRIECW